MTDPTPKEIEVAGQPQTFTSKVRGAQEIHGITMRQLYAIVHEKLGYFHPDRSDPDAFCQDLCCQIERVMGIYPNVPGLTEVSGIDVPDNVPSIPKLP